MEEKPNDSLAKDISAYCRKLVEQVNQKKITLPLKPILPLVAGLMVGEGLTKGGYWDE